MSHMMYGRLSEDVADFAISQDLRPNGWRLFVWLIPRFKAADRLKGEALEAFGAWHEANAPRLDPKRITTVQFTHRQAAAIFNGSHTMSGRYIAELIGAGILEPIAKGKRGNATLYLVCPTCTHSCECANSSTDLHTTDHRLAHKPGSICTHGEAVACGDKTYPVNIPINNPGGASVAAQEEAAQPLTVCPDCGASDSVQREASGLYTCGCGKAWFPTRK